MTLTFKHTSGEWVDHAEAQFKSLKAFARDCIKVAFDGEDLSGSEIQMLAMKHGLLEQVKFDPETHMDMYGYAEAGDDWFVLVDFLK